MILLQTKQQLITIDQLVKVVRPMSRMVMDRELTYGRVIGSHDRMHCTPHSPGYLRFCVDSQWNSMKRSSASGQRIMTTGKRKPVTSIGR